MVWLFSCWANDLMSTPTNLLPLLSVDHLGRPAVLLQVAVLWDQRFPWLWHCDKRQAWRLPGCVEWLSNLWPNDVYLLDVETSWGDATSNTQGLSVWFPWEDRKRLWPVARFRSSHHLVSQSFLASSFMGLQSGHFRFTFDWDLISGSKPYWAIFGPSSSLGPGALGFVGFVQPFKKTRENRISCYERTLRKYRLYIHLCFVVK